MSWVSATQLVWLRVCVLLSLLLVQTQSIETSKSAQTAAAETAPGFPLVSSVRAQSRSAAAGAGVLSGTEQLQRAYVRHLPGRVSPRKVRKGGTRQDDGLWSPFPREMPRRMAVRLQTRASLSRLRQQPLRPYDSLASACISAPPSFHLHCFCDFQTDRGKNCFLESTENEPLLYKGWLGDLCSSLVYCFPAFSRKKAP